MKSIRLRLTVWYSAALAAVLLAYSGGVYLFVKQSLIEALDRELEQDLHAVHEMLEHRADPGAYAETLPGVLVSEAWTSAGVLDPATPGHGPKLGAPPASCFGDTAAGATIDLEGQAVRVLCRADVVDGQRFALRVARSAERIDRELFTLFSIMAAGVPIALFLAAFGGYLLARRALAPVTRMIDRARRIRAENLAERLPIDSEDEIGALARTFNETFARLEQSFEQMRRFSTDASHELRTPLTAIRAVGEVALREPRSAESYAETIGSMLEEADRLRHLVDSLLLLSRADAGQVAIALKPENLREIAEETAHHLGVLAEEKGQRITVEGEAIAQANVDRAVLRQALVNLVHNAIKYGPPSSAIRIAVTRADPRWYIDVRDEGPGIAEEHRSKIFDRFYRIDPEQQGHGLGLAIARWASEAHGGRIDLQTEEGRGSTFRLII